MQPYGNNAHSLRFMFGPKIIRAIVTSLVRKRCPQNNCSLPLSTMLCHLDGGTNKKLYFSSLGIKKHATDEYNGITRRRTLSTVSDESTSSTVHSGRSDNKGNNPRRKWLPVFNCEDGNDKNDNGDVDGGISNFSGSRSVTDNDSEIRIPLYWKKAVGDTDHDNMRSLIDRIGIQEKRGGRMRQRKLGVLREDPKEDMRLLIENYTVPALASALRDREDVLQLCATLLAEQKIDELSVILRPFERQYVEMRRRREINLDLSNGFDASTLEMLRKGLNRMPRRVSQAHQRRAGVVLPLCNVDNVPCILFEKRSAQLRAHADEVCLPGGMVSTSNDRSIVATCLREMHEEIEGLGETNIVTLGVLRCNWGEVHHLVGVAVTPVVCYIGEIGDKDLRPNSDEVAECFTVPLSLFLDHERWVRKPDFAPIFTGGPHMIWGLTGYIVNRFVKDVLARYRVQCPSESSST